MTTWMDQLECSGDESTISECPFSGWGNEDCSHSEDVGVVCTSTTESEGLYFAKRME